MRLITEVCVERGLAAIINIHDVALAQLFAKRIIGLRLGEIVYDGTPDHGRLRSAGRLSYPGFLVSILVPGLLAGIIAIALRSIGFIGKLLYEAIEEIDSSQVEAVAATGASEAQILDYGIIPQILPAFAGITVFRWDINIRESTVLGLVGAGGIGLELSHSLNTLAWPQVSLIFSVILATVVVSEWISAKVRYAII
jgi:phosphonate transport system permease protein